MPAKPVCMPRTGAAAATSSATAQARLSAGRRSTRRTTADQNRPSAPPPAVARPADDGDAPGVEAVAEDGEHRGQQRQGGGHGDEPDQDRARGQAAQDRVRHEDHAEHREHERQPAEQHGPACGRACRRDRLERVRAARALLPHPRDDEQAVVDPEGEAHRGDHVDDEQRQLERLADERRQGHGDDDRDEREHDRHEARHHRSEDEQQHDERGRQTHVELALPEVVLGELLEVPVGGQARR
jgi:hypothetical protein